MEEDFVSRKEFETLKEEVNNIKKDLVESQKLLHTIERKIDIINEKITASNEISGLKIAPIESRVLKLENGINWLWKLCASIIITGIITAIITFK